MSHDEEEDRPTVLIDLKAIKMQKLKEQEEQANIISDLEFNQNSLGREQHINDSETVILFDYGTNFFQVSLDQFPKGFNYKITKNLNELNQCLKQKIKQTVVFNYDVSPKVANQLCAQIKKKMPHIKTLIMASAIDEKKAKLHAQSPFGADGYYQFPLEAKKIADILKGRQKDIEEAA